VGHKAWQRNVRNGGREVGAGAAGGLRVVRDFAGEVIFGGGVFFNCLLLYLLLLFLEKK